ncbi:MAG: hypothetical protein U0103_24050 [Candidatus Obscuribacterales bacterium]
MDGPDGAAEVETSSSEVLAVPDTGRQPLVSYGLAVYALTFMLLRAVPWKPEKYVLSFDISWDLALHYLTCHGAKFGQNLIFTFGPLGFTYARTYYPDNYPTTVAVWTFLSVIQALALYKIARLSFSQAWISLLWLSAAVVTVAFFSDSFFFCFSILLLCDYFLFSENRSIPSKTSIALAVAIGVAASVKFTFVISAALALAFVTLDEVVRKKRLPLLAPIAVSVFLAIWVAYRQPISLLLHFVRYSLEVTRGYSDALALGNSYAQIITTASLALLAFLVMCSVGYRQLKLRSVGFSIALGGVLFAMFKAAYVRHDPGHGTIAAIGFSFFSILLIACVYHCLQSGKIQKSLACLSVFGFLFIVVPWNFGAPIYAFPLLCVSAMMKAATNATLIADDLTVGKRNSQEFERLLSGIREVAPLPSLTGGVDAYPIDAKLIVANHFAYSPRPLLQSYQSYTTALLKADCDHLAAADAPEWLLLSGKPWEDNWLPSLNDGPSLPVIMSLYDEEKLVSGQVLLKRRKTERTVSLKPLKEFSARIGESIDLSSYKDKLLWAQITPQLSFTGEIARFIYHVLPLSIVVEVQNGPVKRFVAPRALLTEGFLLSPCFDTSAQLAKILVGKSRDWQDFSVNKVSLEDRNPQFWSAFRPDVKVKLFELTVESDGLKQAEMDGGDHLQVTSPAGPSAKSEPAIP